MLFSWLKRRRRGKLLAQPLPTGWVNYQEDVAHFGLMSSMDQARVQRIARVVAAEKAWEGCGGLELTEQKKAVIAIQMAILIQGFHDFYFDNVVSILVYPKDFLVRQKESLAGEALLESEGHLLGEAHYRGPVILSWAEIEEDIQRPGHGQNLVFHEFAHQLDMLNGEADGVPLLRGDALTKRWPTVMAAAYQQLIRTTRRGRAGLLDPYGAENPAEFFAVITETFFDQPLPMRAEFPALYELLSDYYCQDPASWPGWSART